MHKIFGLFFGLLFCLSNLVADEYPLRGVIDFIDTESEVVTIRHEGVAGYMEDPGIVQVHLSDGDYAVYKTKDEIEGILYSYKDQWRLKEVWPADEAVRERMEDINRELHQNTMMRGRKVIRQVGESLPPFALYNQLGELVTLDDLKGKPVVFNFIFTRCRMPNMCPAATTRMSQLQQVLKGAGYEDGYQLVSVTLDPEYDSPGVFYDYADIRGIENGTFWFLGGSVEAVKDLKKQIGVIAVKDEKNIINHTMATVVVNASGEIIYRVPGTKWSVQDIFQRVQGELEKAK